MPPDHTKAYQAPPLKPSDFIKTKEMHRLLTSMKQPIGSVARDTLIHRNLAIVHLIRYKVFRPKDVSLLNMSMITMGQSTIALEPYDPEPVYKLSGDHMQPIRAYLHTIAPLKRPQRGSDDPLFVAFNKTGELHLIFYHFLYTSYR